MIARATQRIHRRASNCTQDELAGCKFRAIVKERSDDGRMVDVELVVYPIGHLFYGEQARRLVEKGLAVIVGGVQVADAVDVTNQGKIE